MKNNKKSFILVIIISALVLYFVLKDDFAEKIHYLFSFNPIWLLIAFIAIIIYWLLKGLVLYHCIKQVDEKYTKKQGIYLMVTTQFFHAITPFASGGQPWQIYKLKKDGLNLGSSTNAIIEDFIVYQIALVLLGVIAVISNHIFHIIPNDNALRYLVTIGFAINIVVIVALFLVAFSKKWNKKIIDGIIKLLYKLKIVKDKEKQLKKSEKFVTNFHESALILFKNKRVFIRVIILNFIALLVQYSIPFFLMLGLNIYVNPYFVIVTCAYVMLIDSLIPTPGSTGGLEVGFMSFFKHFIKGPKLSIIMIVWRIVTYYFGIIVGGIALNINEEAIK